MDLCLLTILALLVLFFYLVILFLRADGDHLLMFYERYGKSPEYLTGKVIWITGASSGIGEYLAYELARNGCKLVLSARRTDELERVKLKCLHGQTNLGESDILVLPMDVTDFDKHSECMEVVLKYFKTVDILVNNAGRMQLGSFVDTSLDVHQEVFALNVFGVASVTKTVLPHMVQRKQGHIVVVGSLAGKIGLPYSATYSATKHALQGWFSGMQLELCDHNIDVTMICPAPVHSNIAQNAFREDLSKVGYGTPALRPGAPMNTDRCAHLIAIAVANRLSEAWIATQPYLLLAYMFQYAPIACRRLGQLLKLHNRLADGLSQD